MVYLTGDELAYGSTSLTSLTCAAMHSLNAAVALQASCGITL